MLRFNDIADRMLDYNPQVDLERLQRAYVFTAKVHHGQERLSGEPYLVHPLEVFREVGRVLRPGGLHLVLFSNRVFRTKAIKIWLEAGESERVWLVEDYFQQMGEQFEPHKVFSCQGKPRPPDDPHPPTPSTAWT